MTANDLAAAVLHAGGVLTLAGDDVRCWLPPDATHLVGALKERKPELIALLRRVGGRVATFPHCPRCASYALFREDNRGDYECLTCGLSNIEEGTARRIV
jgi:Zn ribbon nucleic-acid-binding protein